MEIIILGKTADDKGTQLEKLTGRILANLGYIDIAQSEIGNGGFELDIVAEFAQPGIGNTTRRLTICECKAHRTPITTNDWMKFLGKIFTFELGGKHVDGCFIALNGANGNVKGQYRALREMRQDISLISGDELFRILTELYKPVDLQHVQNEIVRLTKRQVLSTSLCYYQEVLYWITTFVDGSYTLLLGSAEIVPNEQSIAVQAVIGATLDLSDFVDLNAEKERSDRSLVVRKYIISLFMLYNKRHALDSIFMLSNAAHGKFPAMTFTMQEIEQGLAKLIDDGMLTLSRKKYQLKILDKNYTQEDVFELYSFLLKDMIVLIAIGSKCYNAFINEALLDKFAEIQGNLPIPEESRKSWIRFLQLSPSALAWAIQPDAYLLQHRGKMESTAELDASDIAYVNQTLALMISKDFVAEGFRDFIYYSGIVEMDTAQVLKIKNDQGGVVHIDFKERIGLAPLQGTQQIIPMRIFNHTDENWNVKKKTAKKK